VQVAISQRYQRFADSSRGTKWWRYGLDAVIDLMAAHHPCRHYQHAALAVQAAVRLCFDSVRMAKRQ